MRQKYRALVERVRQAESPRAKGLDGLAEAVARYYFKLLAYKDEYEVARLYADPAFMEKIKSQFDGDYKLHFHLAPPLFSKRDPVTGELRKSEYGGWVFGAFKVLAKLRGLRGTAFDIFGYTQERRMERQLIADYEADDRGIDREADCGQPCTGCEDRLHSGGNPRLWPCQGTQPEGGESEGSRSAGCVPLTGEGAVGGVTCRKPA